MALKEENLRLKIALSAMIEQFYSYRISKEEADDYNIKYNENDNDVECYFHLFESAGERAWNMLGFKKPIISKEELFELDEKLRTELLSLLKNK